MKKFFTREWLPATIIFVGSVAYFFVRVCDSTFRDNALGNLFATVMGIVVGIPIGLEINRMQQDAQRAKEEKEKIAELEEQRIRATTEQEAKLKQIVSEIGSELTNNKSRIERLQEALNITTTFTQDHWEWAVTISDSLSTNSFEALVNSEIDKNLWKNIFISLYIAYPIMIYGLRNRVREEKAAYKVYLMEGNQDDADRALNYVRDLSRQSLQRAKEALEEIQRFKRYKKYIE